MPHSIGRNENLKALVHHSGHDSLFCYHIILDLAHPLFVNLVNHLVDLLLLFRSKSMTSPFFDLLSLVNYKHFWVVKHLKKMILLVLDLLQTQILTVRSNLAFFLYLSAFRAWVWLSKNFDELFEIHRHWLFIKVSFLL